MSAHYSRSGKHCVAVYTCNAEACPTIVTDQEIIAGGGMTKMGWLRRFDDDIHQHKHFCPLHAKE